MARAVGVIQARTGSSRLPGKVLRPVLGRSVLEWVIRAATAVEGLDEVVVATTTDSDDDEVVALAHAFGVRAVRGDVDDVLTRFLLALEGADSVVRFTGDCPLLDPVVVATVLRTFEASPGCAHASTIMPRCLPRGLDAEVASVEALRDLDGRLTTAQLAHHRSHVTSYLYTHPEVYDVVGVTFHPAADDLRVTLDTADDLRLVHAVADVLGDRPPGHREIVALLRQQPDIAALNSHVRQKALEAS